MILFSDFQSGSVNIKHLLLAYVGKRTTIRVMLWVVLLKGVRN